MKAQCAYVFRCCDDDERLERGAQLGVSGNYLTSEGECVDRNLGISCFGAKQTDDSVALGRQQVDEDAQQECLDAVNDAVGKCDIEDYLTARQSLACAHTVNPQVKDKDDCALSSECISGQCNIERDKDGLAKNYDEDLDAPQGECAEIPGEGEKCPDGDCATGLICSFDTGKCVELGDKGDKCTDNIECKSFVCDDQECDDNKVNLDKKFCEGRD